MSKKQPKKPKKEKIQELPAMEGPGVAVLTIPDLDKAIDKYEAAKDARCHETPLELAAKKEMKFKLQQHKSKLPVVDGKPFYRYQEKDYILDEKLVVKKVVESDDD